MAKAMFYNGKYLYTPDGLLAMGSDCCCGYGPTESVVCAAYPMRENDSSPDDTETPFSITVQKPLTVDVTVGTSTEVDPDMCPEPFGVSTCEDLEATWSMSNTLDGGLCDWTFGIPGDGTPGFVFCCSGTIAIFARVVERSGSYHWWAGFSLISTGVAECVVSQQLSFISAPLTYDAVNLYWRTAGGFALTKVYENQGSGFYCDPFNTVSLNMVPVVI